MGKKNVKQKEIDKNREGRAKKKKNEHERDKNIGK